MMHYTNPRSLYFNCQPTVITCSIVTLLHKMMMNMKYTSLKMYEFHLYIYILTYPV